MVGICLLGVCLLIIVVCEVIRRHSHKYNKISFRESLDLCELPVITFKKNGVKYNFLLDTGASLSIFNSTNADSIEHTIIEDTACSVYGMEGNETKGLIAKISFDYPIVFTSNFQFIDMSSAFNAIKEESGVTIHGILGNDFFVRFKYILDYESMVAYSKA